MSQKNAVLFFELKEDEEIDDLDSLFNSDEHIEQHFEFDEMNEEYFDSNFRHNNVIEHSGDINNYHQYTDPKLDDIPF